MSVSIPASVRVMMNAINRRTQLSPVTLLLLNAIFITANLYLWVLSSPQIVIVQSSVISPREQDAPPETFDGDNKVIRNKIPIEGAINPMEGVGLSAKTSTTTTTESSITEEEFNDQLFAKRRLKDRKNYLDETHYVESHGLGRGLDLHRRSVGVNIPARFDSPELIRSLTDFITLKKLPTEDKSIPFTPNQTAYFAKTRPTYRVPKITYTNLVNCANILADDGGEIAKARQIVTTREHTKAPIGEEVYLEWLRDCPHFKKMRGYVQIPLTKEEEDYPLAFSIAMYKDIEQAERLLRAIYQPQNVYCIHIDTKAPLLLHRTVRALAACFDNVFIASHLDKIKWGDVSVLLPALNCMRDLVKYYKGKWKYYINLTGQEFPLKTNYELVKIAKIFNGSNDIAGSRKRMELERTNFRWTHRWSRTYQQTIFYNTLQPKIGPPFNLTFYKGELHGFFSSKMAEFIIESEVGQKYLEWCWDSGHPTEHYWNTLNYNKHIAAPGGYDGPMDEAEEYSSHPAIRVKLWTGLGFYKGRACKGIIVRGICVYGIADVPWLAKRNELVANKFHLTYEYLAYDCLEERHRNRTMQIGSTFFDPEFYKNLPTVKYGRNDGL